MYVCAYCICVCLSVCVYMYVCVYMCVFVLGLCDNDITYILITPPKLILINDIISIVFLHTI